MANREQILNTTAGLFLKRGCRALTMDEVASANGMSKRTLYEMFGDKGRLLEECIRFAHERSMKEMERDMDASDNPVKWFIASLERKVQRKANLYHGFFSDVKRYYPEVCMSVVAMANRRHCEFMERIILRGQEQGLFLSENVDAHDLALMLRELSEAVADKAMREDVDMERIADALMLFLIRGISTDKGMEIIDNYLNKKH